MLFGKIKGRINHFKAKYKMPDQSLEECHITINELLTKPDLNTAEKWRLNLCFVQLQAKDYH